MLTPAKSDPNYISELMRRSKDPDSFGAGDVKTEQLAKKLESEKKAKAAADKKAADEAAAAKEALAEAEALARKQAEESAGKK